MSNRETLSTRVRAARECVRRERGRLADEVRAFETFVADVRDIPVAAHSRSRGGTLLVEAARDSDGRPVRDAYESTVMSVPHYDEDYGDGVEESIAAELGSTVAAGLRGSRFDEQCRRAVIAAARRARERRTALLDDIETEANSLDAAATAIDDIESDLEGHDDGTFEYASFEALMAARDALTEQAARARSIAAERQAVIRENSFTASADRRRRATGDLHLQEYLYADLDRTYPVLSAVTELAARIDRRRTRRERAIATY